MFPMIQEFWVRRHPGNSSPLLVLHVTTPTPTGELGHTMKVPKVTIHLLQSYCISPLMNKFTTFVINIKN